MVATPIGNLSDITLRAIETLKMVDAIAAEDTRHTSGLLAHLGISKKMIAVHEHNEQQSAEKLLNALQAGEHIALVTDAGTPAVSDPGAIVVDAAHKAGIKVVPVPGVSAVIAALSASGITQNGFLFYGFLPASSAARKKILTELKPQTVSLVFYEAPHRILESIADFTTIFGDARQIVFARELTKTFETIYRCALGDALNWLNHDANQQRGEFVLLVAPEPAKVEEELDEQSLKTLGLLLAELPLKQAVKLAVEITGKKKNALYEAALKRKQSMESN